MYSRSVLLLALSVSGFVAACGSDSNTPATTSTDAGGDTKVDPVGETGTPAEPCSEPAEERPVGSQCVKTVTGKVVDASGAPLPAKKLVSVCGQVCFFGETAADGTFVAKVGRYIKVSNFAASVHGRPDFVSLYEKLPAGTSDDIALPTMVLPKVPADGAAIPMDSKDVVTDATMLSDGDLTLNIAAGTAVELDLEDVELGETGKLFRAVKIETKDYPTFAKGANVAMLYAATPFDAKFTKKVAVTFKAVGDLAEGTAVEIVALGNDFLREPFTAGKLEVVATGKVTGGRVVTDAGQGISTLTWLGVRAK